MELSIEKTAAATTPGWRPLFVQLPKNTIFKDTLPSVDNPALNMFENFQFVAVFRCPQTRCCSPGDIRFFGSKNVVACAVGTSRLEARAM
jgi:hypothetical protein